MMHREAIARGDADVDHVLARLAASSPPSSRAPHEEKEAFRDSFTLIERHARTFGLSPAHVGGVVSVAMRGGLHDALAKRLFRALVPRSSVPEMCVVNALGRCAQRTPDSGECVVSVGIQAHFLRWLVGVFEFLDSRDRLHLLYGVVFRLVAFDTLRGDACHLLYLLTRPRDVQAFRLRRLLELREQVGPEPALLALIAAYRSIAPLSAAQHALAAEEGGRASFRLPSAKLREAIRQVRERLATPHRALGASGDAQAPDALRRSDEQAVALRLWDGQSGSAAKRARTDPIPAASTAAALGLADAGAVVSAAGSVASLEDLCARIGALELPAQAAAVLGSRGVQHAVVCAPNAGAFTLRLSNWLAAALPAELAPGRTQGDSEARAARLLSALCDLADFAHDVPPAVNAFLASYLPTWNGVDHRALVLRLAARVRPCAYEELYAGVLRPLNALFFSSGPEVKAEILMCYRDMVARFAMSVRRAGESRGEGLVFGPMAARVDHYRTLYELVRHVDATAVVGLETERDHVAVLDAALSFFETVVEFSLHYRLPFLIVPSDGIVYRCFFASNAMAVSRIAGLVARYRAAFDTLKDRQPAPDHAMDVDGASSVVSDHSRLSIPRGLESLNQLNGYIMDFCNVLWRNRVLPEDGGTDPTNCFDLSSKAKQRLRELVPDMGAAFSVTQSPAFCSMTRQYLVDCQQQAAAAEGREVDLSGVRPSVIRDRFRVPFLDFLRARNLNGLYEFLYNFINSLVQRRAKGLERRGVGDAL